MINFEKTIISQYANSETIFALIEQFNDCIDPPLGERIGRIYV